MLESLISGDVVAVRVGSNRGTPCGESFAGSDARRTERFAGLQFVVFQTLVVFTPKALHSEAQGREAWRAHPGFRAVEFRVPQRGSTIRVHYRNRSRLVEPRWGSWLYSSTTQGALTPFATLGFGVKRLRRRNLLENETFARRLGARIGQICRNLLPRLSAEFASLVLALVEYALVASFPLCLQPSPQVSDPRDKAGQREMKNRLSDGL